MKTLMELARLSINKDSIDGFKRDLTDILGLLDQLQQVDTSNTKPLANPRDDMLKLRDDEVGESDQRDILIKNAPESAAGLYLVPKVVE